MSENSTDFCLRKYDNISQKSDKKIQNSDRISQNFDKYSHFSRIFIFCLWHRPKFDNPGNRMNIYSLTEGLACIGFHGIFSSSRHSVNNSAYHTLKKKLYFPTVMKDRRSHYFSESTPQKTFAIYPFYLLVEEYITL